MGVKCTKAQHSADVEHGKKKAARIGRAEGSGTQRKKEKLRRTDVAGSNVKREKKRSKHLPMVDKQIPYKKKIPRTKTTGDIERYLAQKQNVSYFLFVHGFKGSFEV